VSLGRAGLSLVRKIVQEDAGIVIPEGKEYLIESGLRTVARRMSLPDQSAVLARLQRGDPEIRREVVDSATIPETQFFRDGHPFEVLRDHVLPEVLARRRTTRSLNLWSAAAATGQEPYSLAILLAESFPYLRSWRVRFLASDLSHHALERAERGVYSDLEIKRGVPEHLLDKYFHRAPEGWCLDPEVRRQVEFAQFNLVRPWPHLPPMDLILLRNVIIYLDEESRASIFGRVKGALRPGGYLVLGASEALLDHREGLEQIQHGRTILYRRV
jgi:chemotaxis protein methyltransferase CheR